MSDEPAHHSAGASKRPRPVISCLECRRKKLKCDRLLPCQQCVKLGRPGRCSYQAGQEPEPNGVYLSASPSKRQRFDSPITEKAEKMAGALSRIEAHIRPNAGRGVIEDLQERVIRLENALLAQDQQRNGTSVANHTSPAPEGFEDCSDGVLTPSAPIQIRDQFKDACALISSLQSDGNNPTLSSLRADLRTIHCTVELNKHRFLNKPVPPSPAGHRPLDLPPFPVCEKLATLYFDNMEHCFRILHYPTFREQLRILFTDGEASCSFGFVPQLLGVLMVAKTLGIEHECEAASSSTILHQYRALKYMTDFLSSIRHRQRYQLPVLQVRMLLLVCKWSCLDPLDDSFRLSGEILRDALVMRLDEDPSTLNEVSIFDGELRRRLWMTIIEIDLMLSFLCKTPCMVPPYTSRPPQNVNDDELFADMRELPRGRPIEEWTDGLCQYVLSQSFSNRVAACKQMDSRVHLNFEDIRVQTRFLEKVLQELPAPLRFSYIGDQASKTPGRLMARMELDFSIRRPLMHLYTCFASRRNANEIQQESIDGFLQSCLMMTSFQDLFDPRYSEIDVPRPEGYWNFFHNLYRHEVGQAILGLCLEIKRLSAVALFDDPAAPGAASTSGPSHVGLRSPVFTKTSLIHSVQDTLEPMKLRLSYPGAVFKDIVYFYIVLTSLLPEQPGETKRSTILNMLQNLVRDCFTQLQRDNIQLVASPTYQDFPGFVDSSANQACAPGADYDAVLAGFPPVDIFEPLDLSDSFASHST